MKKLKYVCCLMFLFIMMLAIPKVNGAASCDYYIGDHKYSTRTCTKAGKCACGATLKAYGHSYTVRKAILSYPTCTSSGRARYKCSRCSATTVKSYGSAKGHNYTNYLYTTKEPTCQKKGVAVYDCSRSGCSKTTKKALSKIDHKYTKYLGITKNPTCTKTGIGKYQCKMCTKTKSITVPKKDHVYTKYLGITTEPTCIKTGIGKYQCKTCTKTKSITVPKIDHKYTKYNGITKNPTCTKTGIGEYQCKGCTATKEITVPVIDHKYTKYNGITKNPTCTETGIGEYQCTMCESTQKITVPKIDHEYIKYLGITQEPTCTETGIGEYQCTTCESTQKITVPVIDHQYTKYLGITKESTCTETGIGEYQCTMCELTQKLTVPVIDHQYTKYLGITQEPTCTKTGIGEYQCTMCELTQKLIVPKKEHKYTIYNGVAQEPTETTTGIGSYQCECGETLYIIIPKLGEEYEEFDANNEEHIKIIQTRLQALGYYTNYSVDGVFGNGTLSAINEMLLLAGEDIRISSKEDITQSIYAFIMGVTENKETSIEKMIEERYGYTASDRRAFLTPESGVAKGSRGSAVKWIQIALNNWNGADVLAVDGDFGSGTEGALIQFQEQMGLNPTGVLDDQTIAKLEGYANMINENIIAFERPAIEEGKCPLLPIIYAIDKYYYENGYKYCKCTSGYRSTIVEYAKPISENHTCESEGISTNTGDLITDCSTYGSAVYYEIGLCYENEEMMNYFSRQIVSDGFNQIYTDGGITFEDEDGVTISLIPVKKSELQEGDMILYEGHVEFDAGYVGENGKKMVWNAGNSDHLQKLGPLEAGRASSGINGGLRLVIEEN